MICGRVGNPHPCALPKTDSFGKGVNLFFERKRILRVGSRDSFRRVDAVAWLYFFDAIPNRLNHARAIRARRVRQRRVYVLLSCPQLVVLWMSALAIQITPTLSHCPRLT